MKCCFINFNGKVYEKISIELVIEKFCGIKRIDSLDIFPLYYHSNQNEIKINLIECD